MVFKAKRTGKGLDWKSAWVITSTEYTLRNVMVKSSRDLIELKLRNDDVTRYKLKYSAGVEIPINFMSDNPSVVETLPEKTFRDFPASEKAGAEIAEVGSYSATDGLKEFLATRGLDKRDIRRAVSMARDAERKISD